ncbi:hypothetical protein L1887_38694 [Cichorium endivia]|nr:hypothetical protein L1887_38694 [Cichorium endivia]
MLLISVTLNLPLPIIFSIVTTLFENSPKTSISKGMLYHRNNFHLQRRVIPHPIFNFFNRLLYAVIPLIKSRICDWINNSKSATILNVTGLLLNTTASPSLVENAMMIPQWLFQYTGNLHSSIFYGLSFFEIDILGEKELEELGVSKENVEKQLRDEHCKVLSLINEKNFENTIAANESTIENLTSKLSELQLELTSKEDRLNDMNNLNERKEKENADLIANKKHLTEQLEKTMQANQSLEDSVKMLTFLNATSKKDALQLVNQELNNKISELQNAQKSTIAKHAEECRVAEEKFLKLKSQAETLLSKKTAMENLISRFNIVIPFLPSSPILRFTKLTCRLLPRASGGGFDGAMVFCGFHVRHRVEGRNENEKKEVEGEKEGDGGAMVAVKTDHGRIDDNGGFTNRGTT